MKRRILGDLLSPLLADRLPEFGYALDHSISSYCPIRSSKTRCRSRHTPASCHSCRRRQHVEPDPQPISLGSITQGIPALRMKTMPVSAARLGTRGLPPLGLGGSGGSSGSTISHTSSVTNFFAMHRSASFEKEQVFQDGLLSALSSVGLSFSSSHEVYE